MPHPELSTEQKRILIGCNTRKEFFDLFAQKYGNGVQFQDLPQTLYRQGSNMWSRREQILESLKKADAKEAAKKHTVMIPATIKQKISAPNGGRADDIPDIGELVTKCLHAQTQMHHQLAELITIQKAQLELFKALEARTKVSTS